MYSSQINLFCKGLLLMLFDAVLCEYRRVCYYTNWSQYRPGHGRFTPENIPLHHCTHVIYSFADMEGNRLKAYEWNDESSYGMKGMFERFNDIKKQQPGLKTLLAVGGWNFGTAKMSSMLKTKQNQEEFIRSTIDFLRQRDFDGIDLDFEYPGARGSGPEDKWRFAYLIKDMRKSFEQESAATRKPTLLLTAAVPAGKSYIDGGYDIPIIMPYVDWVSIMTYDFHGKWESRTGHNSPLYPRDDEQGSARHLNMEFASNYWVQSGAPRQKLNIGLPLYGRSFTLSDKSKSGINAPAVDGGGRAGKYTRENGYLAYYEVCDFVNQGAERFWLDEQKVPYAVKEDQWVGYDDEKSLGIKVDWIRSQGFGGVMVWALDLDDFTGTCGTGKWPLLTTITDKLGGLSVQPINNYIPNSGLATKPMYNEQYESAKFPGDYNPWDPQIRSDEPVSSRHSMSRSLQEIKPVKKQRRHSPQLQDQRKKSFSCKDKKDGYYRHPEHCNIFYQCHLGKGTTQRCPLGTVFSPSLSVCGFPGLVHCPSSSYHHNKQHYDTNKKNTRTTTLQKARTSDRRPVQKQQFSYSGRTPRTPQWYLHTNPLLDLFRQFNLDQNQYYLETSYPEVYTGKNKIHHQSHLSDSYGYDVGLF